MYLLLPSESSHVKYVTKYDKGILVYGFLAAAALWVWSAASFDGVSELGFSNRGNPESMEGSSSVSSAKGLGSTRSSSQQTGRLMGPRQAQQLFLGEVKA